MGARLDPHGRQRLPFDDASRRRIRPRWSFDGKFVVFNSNRQNGYWALFRRAADGSGEDELVAHLPPPDML